MSKPPSGATAPLDPEDEPEEPADEDVRPPLLVTALEPALDDEEVELAAALDPVSEELEAVLLDPVAPEEDVGDAALETAPVEVPAPEEFVAAEVPVAEAAEALPREPDEPVVSPLPALAPEEGEPVALPAFALWIVPGAGLEPGLLPQATARSAAPATHRPRAIETA